MPFLQCMVCGALSKGTRCPTHQRAYNAARGKGSAHQKARSAALGIRPVCNHCGHRASATGRCIDPACERCPIQLDHVEPIRGGRSQGDSRRQLLCRKCNRAKSDS